jgi:hypothetical protein
LATATGSIPELAEAAALYCHPTPTAIRDGLVTLCDPEERARHAEAARRRAQLFGGSSVAAAHLELFREVFDG